MFKQSIRRIARSLNLPPRNVVFLEGGLGSQLMGMLLFEVRRLQDPATQCDVSYFFPEIFQPQLTDGATRWPWELHRYGINLHDPRFVRHRWYRLRAAYETRARDDEPYAASLAEKHWSTLFPIVEAARQRVQDLGVDDADGYASVHIRRGDYLKVSARVLGLPEVLDFIRSLHALLPKRILFLSDDDFLSVEMDQVRTLLAGKECLFVNESDQHVVHGMMRLSKVLITSNSSFSWSAGLMLERPDALAFAPEHFFGTLAPHLNNVFQAPARWMIVGPGSQHPQS